MAKTIYWNPLGAANFNSANAWSLTDGGTRNQTFASGDTCIFTNTNSANCTLTASATIASLTFAGGTGYIGTFTHNASCTLQIAGSLTLSSGMTYTYASVTTSSVQFTASSGAQTLTTATKTLPLIQVSLTSTATLTAQDNITLGGAFTHTSGSFLLNAKTLTAVNFVGTSTTTRSLNITNSTINLSRTGPTNVAWNIVTTGLTFTSTGSVINLTGSSAVFTAGGLTYNEVNFTCLGAASINGGTYSKLTRSIPSYPNTVEFIISATVTIANSGTLSFVGGADNRSRVLVRSNYSFLARTFSLGTGVTHTHTRADFWNIGFNSAVNFSAITGGCGKSGVCTNLTASTARTLYAYMPTSGTKYWSCYTGTNWWWTGSGGTGTQLSGVDSPLLNDTVVFDASSIGQTGTTIQMDQPNLCASLTTTNVLRTPAFTERGNNLYIGGGLMHGTVTSSGTVSTYNFIGANGGSFSQGSIASFYAALNVQFIANATFDLYSDITLQTTSKFTITSGGMYSNDYNITAYELHFNNYDSYDELDFGYGNTFKSTCTANVNVIDILGGATIYQGTCTFEVSGDTESANRMVDFNGYRIYNLNISGISKGTGSLKIVNSVTIEGTFTIAAGNIVKVTAGKTITLDPTASIQWIGNSVNEISMMCLVDGNTWTITRPTGSKVESCDWINLNGSVATQSNMFYAGANSTDNGYNTNWLFTAPPSGNDGKFFLFLT